MGVNYRGWFEMPEDIDRLKPLGYKDAKWTKYWSNSPSRFKNTTIVTVYLKGEEREVDNHFTKGGGLLFLVNFIFSWLWIE